ncbi:MAG: hypothetical protein M0C28_34585 [Candidatus Moduliflexus flocculans]|nr:hypothetical protein [Candidatus Moduliflexus flocculans]
MSALILNQAHNLTDNECQRLCGQLVSSFTKSVEQVDGKIFQAALANILQITVVGEDDASVWQEAVSFLGMDLGESASVSLIREMLDAAQLTISAQMQHQYRNYVLHERWTSSRLDH